MRLDDRVVGADSRYADVSLEQLLAQRARLEAERLGRSSIDFPPQLAAKNSPSARAAIADERNLFVLRRAEQGRIGAQLAARTSQLNDQIAGYRAQIASLQKQRELIQPELQGLRDLWERRLVTIGRLNQLERAAIDLDGNIASLEAQIASTRGEIAQVQQQSMQLAATRRAEAGQELSNLNIALNQQQFRAVAAADQQSRREIRAPYAGTVEKLAFAANGEVVRPAETIMEIVPTADQLIVEVAIDPTDVDQVRVGQSATVLFPSINRAATPTLPGSVVYVAADRSTDPERRSSFFLARVSLEPADVRAARLNLQSGMPAEVHIQTRSRTLLSYILKPLADQFARAFRDG
jgi:HlyD family secretion protein